MDRILQITPIFVDEIPEEIKEGFIYICFKYETASHLCACGCKRKTVTPLGSGEWTITNTAMRFVTLRPSIGNFKGEYPYHAHYYITNNNIEWL